MKNGLTIMLRMNLLFMDREAVLGNLNVTQQGLQHLLQHQEKNLNILAPSKDRSRCYSSNNNSKGLNNNNHNRSQRARVIILNLAL